MFFIKVEFTNTIFSPIFPAPFSFSALSGALHDMYVVRLDGISQISVHFPSFFPFSIFSPDNLN